MQMLGLENVSENFLDFNDISMETLGCHMLFGDTDEEGVKAATEFILKSNIIFRDNRLLNLFVNTPGGNITDGFALIDVMSASRLQVKTIGIGSVASMGVLILSAGHKGHRTITKNTEVMAHQFYAEHSGKFHELVSVHKAEIYAQHQFIQHFKTHSNMSEKQIKDIVFGTSDNWLSPSECKKYGLVDHVVDELPDFTPQPVRSVSVRSKRPSRQ